MVEFAFVDYDFGRVTEFWTVFPSSFTAECHDRICKLIEKFPL